MKFTEWSILNDNYEKEKKRSRDALFTIGNGYFGIRGFFEEDTQGIDALGGIYMAGVFGKGENPVCIGQSRELCNVSNVFRTVISIDGERMYVSEQVEEFFQEVDLKSAIYRRGYIYTTKSGKKVRVKFERFASLYHRHLMGQKISVEALNEEANIQIDMLLDSKITNLNLESCEPLPIQPGRNHITKRNMSNHILHTKLDDTDETVISFAQKIFHSENAKMRKEIQTEYDIGYSYELSLKAGEQGNFEKLVCVYTSKDFQNAQKELENFLADTPLYNAELENHQKEWKKKWEVSDIVIDAENHDQTALRYNIFHLICVCPEYTDKLSIGARGLSGEMYEGCVFWDTEIFKLPFFIYTNPKAAKNLLKFRYYTLDAARENAKRNWFQGAMYPWQGSEKGIEQTPYNGGAYYAIHIVADIAYAVKQYWEVTNDDEFMSEYGTEILVETARFFASRCDYNRKEQVYEIRAVRGPNEYDVFVNNNVYTNMMAVENLKTALSVLDMLKEKYPEERKNLFEKLSIKEGEMEHWNEIAHHMKIPYDKEKKLYLEDDAYLNRRVLNMKKAKPTGKRIIDSTLPYEALPVYQVTKQADVVLLMDLLPYLFSREEQKIVYDFYEPRTAHDSSLSYAPHGIISARIGNQKEAERYFKKSAYLDIEDIQLNTISGLHFANFGGTWQLAYLGYAGISQNRGLLCIDPCLPSAWKKMQIFVLFKGEKIQVTITQKNITVKLCENAIGLKIRIRGKEQELTSEKNNVCVEY